MELPANLRETTLAELIQLIELHSSSGRLQIIRTDTDERASIFFTQGQVVHATTPRCQGEDAIIELFSWDKGKILFSEASAIPPRSINLSNTDIIIKGLGEAQETAEFMIGLPPMPTVLRLNTSSMSGDSGEKITLDISEWNFLILVDGRRTLQQIFDECNLSQSQAAKLIGRLLEQKVVVPIR